MPLPITLPDEIARLVEEKLAEGGWDDPVHVVGAALLAMPGEPDLEVDELRRLWDEGIASGDAGELDFELIKQEIREKLALKSPS